MNCANIESLWLCVVAYSYNQRRGTNKSFAEHVPVDKKPDKAFCKPCKKELTAVVTALRKHRETAYHKEKVSALADPFIVRLDSMLVDRGTQSSVQDAEIKMAGFLSEHDLPFKVMDHLSDLLPKIFPDSKIASRFKSKRTKTTNIVKNALAPYFHQELVARLRKGYFSLIIDETTDVSVHKELAVVIRQFDKENMKVRCSLYDLVELPHGTAEILFNTLMDMFEKDDIPLSNIIGFAADTTNVMFGGNNSVVSRLKDKIPSIFVLRCICHSAHLCASHACEKLPRTAEEILHDVYNYFCHSAKRQSEFAAFQEFADIEPHRLLRPAQTRWLSLHACVSRLIEQWDALVLYFQAVAARDNLIASQRIISLLQNCIWKLYFYFLDFVATTKI